MATDRLHRAKRLFLAGFLLAGLFLFGRGVEAAAVNLGLTPEVGSALGLGTQDLRITIATVIRNFMGFLGILAVLLILYGGFLYMTSRGEEERIAKAKQVIVSAVIGLAIVLSAVAITQFVLRALGEATGLTTGTSFGGAGGGGGGGLPAGAFYLQDISPSGAVPIRNVVVRVILSQAVDATSVTGNLSIAGPDGVVPGTVSTKGNLIEFEPSAACPEPNDQLKCFAADTTYTVTLSSAVKASGGQSLQCGGIAPPCSASFATGDLIDLAAPDPVEILAPDEGQSVPENTPLDVQVHAVDDAAISFVEVFADGTPLLKASPGGVVADFTGIGTSESAPSLGSHALTAEGHDVDKHSTISSSVGIVVRPLHCFNKKQDVGETAVDCGGACGACGGGACMVASDCASGVCENGLCIERPRIDAVTPLDASKRPNGAPGTMVSISGSFFGNAPGRVVFLGTGAATAREAPLCAAGAWNEGEVTVLVPADAVDGPIQIIAANNQSDATNDARGALVNDFDVNAENHPGICIVSPIAAELGSQVVLSGTGFGAEQGSAGVTFRLGTQDAAAPIDAGQWSENSVAVRVPTFNLSSFQQATIRLSRDGVESNRKNFSVEPLGAGSAPRIDQIDPATGPVGEYVTLSGANFGGGIGTVLFTLPDNTVAVADTAFPDACGTEYWQDRSVTVKVPAFYQDAQTPIQNVAHGIKVRRSDSVESNSAPFSVTSGLAGPGICALIPDNGPPVTTKTDIVGERFGTIEGTVSFAPDQAASAVGFWSNTRISKVGVPTLASTGPVKVVAAGNNPSNGVPFFVGMCTADSQCSAGDVCCGDGSCRKSCTAAGIAGGYAWRFSTGDIPVLPQMVEEKACVGLPQSPSPYKNTRDACVNAVVSGRITADMEDASLVGNVFMEQCGQSGDFDPSTCTTPVSPKYPLQVSPWTTSPSPVASLGGGDKFTFTPEALLPDTWYRVRIRSSSAGDPTVGAKSVAGLFLDGDFDGNEGGDYLWAFRTRNDPSLCAVDHIEVTPSDYLLQAADATLDYRADPTAANCNVLECGSYGWDWRSELSDAQSSSGDTYGPLAPVAGQPACVRRATALQETPPAAPLKEIASLPEFGKTDHGILTISFLKPEVMSYWPNCAGACVNAGVGAMFNVGMKPETISAQTVKVCECTEESCASFSYCSDTIANAAVSYRMSAPDSQGKEHVMGFSVNGLPLKSPARWYRAFIAGGPKGVLSESGSELVGTNYGTFFSWKFRTRNDSALCEVDRVSVAPASASVYLFGDTISYASDPISAGDDQCGPTPLTATDYDWQWQAANISGVAELEEGVVPNASIASLDFDGKKDTLLLLEGQGCSTMCLRTGSAPGGSVCGNNKKELGEDCDDGNTAPGDGCSSFCLAEGAFGTCGNGTLEKGESCDDGNLQSGDGCSSLCIMEGSGYGATLCGNGKLDPGENCDDANKAAKDGCSASCLLEGSIAGQATCGNGSLEKGEYCDDGNAADGDGCSSFCLAEGATASCGNKAVNVGEDCDDGNTAAGDGCNASCLAEGTTAAGSVCGNGDVGKGEACDDGNLQSGDGCSSECLNEGTKSAYPVCGNGAVEAGEDCDDGNLKALDGCSVFCLAEGTRVCTGSKTTNCCGNGGAPEKGETCDDGNAFGGDGCSATCRKEGSSSRYNLFGMTPSYCGYTADVQAPATLGTGEMCEFKKSGDGLRDPVQIARAAFGGTASIDSAVKNPSSQSTVSGTGSFTFNCNCSDDNSCLALVPSSKIPAAGVGCGLGKCCYTRPKVISTDPANGKSQVCRNALIAATFDAVMDKSSVASSTLLLVKKGAGACPTGTEIPVTPTIPGIVGSYCLAAAKTGPLYTVGVGTTTDDFGAVRGQARIELKEALAPGTVYGVLVVGDHDLEDAAKDGALSASKVGMNGDYFWNFTTGAEICKIDHVRIEPASWLFSTAQNDPTDDVIGPLYDSREDRDKQYVSETWTKLTTGDFAKIVSTPGYAWQWGWQSSDVNEESLKKSAAGNLGEQWIETIEQPKNEDVTITVRATVTENVFGKPCTSNNECGNTGESCVATSVGNRCNGEKFEAKSTATVLICENPWPARKADGSWKPFMESATSFSAYYCRDAGRAADTSDDLPAPISEKPSAITHPDERVCSDNPFKGCSTSADCAASGAICHDRFLLDLLFPLNCAGGRCNPGDAFGFRVVPNLPHEDVKKWYAFQGFEGAPSPTTVDGYPAISEARTTYVSAVNKVGDPSLYTNIYLLSYTQNASASTQQTVASLRDNWQFNTNVSAAGLCKANVCSGEKGKACVADSDCGDKGPCGPISCTLDSECSGAGGLCNALKPKIQRDVTRLTHFRGIEAALEGYRTSRLHCSKSPDRACLVDDNCPVGEACLGEYPTLPSGSYIRGLSTSVWESWQSTLGDALKITELPKDPLNTLVCPAVAGFDEATCFNQNTLSFACERGSHAYVYRKEGKAYRLSSDFEYRVCNNFENFACLSDADCVIWKDGVQHNETCAAPTWVGIGPAKPVEFDEGKGIAAPIGNIWEFANACTGATLGGGEGICGDGVVGPSEACEPGQKKFVACSENGYNGIATEVCGTDGADLCKWVALSGCAAGTCGDGILQTPQELCDDGSKNGAYGHCDVSCLGDSKAGHCGDGIVQGVELCDLGGFCRFDTGLSCQDDDDCWPGGVPNGDWCVGASVYGGQTSINSCSLDCKSSGPWCGDGIVQPEFDEQCDSNIEVDKTTCGVCDDQKIAAGDCAVADKGRLLVRSRNCKMSAAPYCTWNNWSACTVSGACGDGILDKGEICDDGNDNNNDGCVIVKKWNTASQAFQVDNAVSCKKAACGDGFVLSGVEGCDTGGKNVSLSDAAKITTLANQCPYGKACQFCTTSCAVSSVSGGVCGDAKVAPAYEVCEAALGPGNDEDVEDQYGAIPQICSLQCQSFCPPVFQKSPGLQFTETLYSPDYFPQIDDYKSGQERWVAVPSCRYLGEIALDLAFSKATVSNIKVSFGSITNNTVNGAGEVKLPLGTLCCTDKEQRVRLKFTWTGGGTAQLKNVTPTLCPLLPGTTPFCYNF